VSNPHFLKVLKREMLFVVKGDVKRNELMPKRMGRFGILG
jgi:hypothetical protein